MNEEALAYILEHYCSERGMVVASLPAGVSDIICATSAPYLLMLECLEQLDPSDPTGGLLAKLIQRAYGTVAASLALADPRRPRLASARGPMT